MYNTFPLEIIESKLAKLKPSKYNRFFWWRRWSQKNQLLDKNSSFFDKIQNGDFEESPYFWQIKYCEYEINQKQIQFKDYQRFLEESKLDRIRRRRLIDDYEKDETERLVLLKKEFINNFHFNEKTLEEELLSFDGTIKDFYIHCNTKYCKKIKNEKV